MAGEETEVAMRAAEGPAKAVPGAVGMEVEGAAAVPMAGDSWEMEVEKDMVRGVAVPEAVAKVVEAKAMVMQAAAAKAAAAREEG